jgi:hypothetical protein
MQDYQAQPQSQFPAPLPGADGASSASPAQAQPTIDQQYPQTPPSTAQADPLTQASEAVEACIARTGSSPNARMREIAKIRAAYIKAKFGMDLTQ